jgi:hypothetical protein
MEQESSVQMRAKKLGLISLAKAPITIQKPNDD